MSKTGLGMQGRGIVYVRRSSTQQDGSLRQQLDWAVGAAARMNVLLEVTPDALDRASAAGAHCDGDLYCDSYTGGSMSRPGFRAFLARAKADRTISHVFVWDRDRFARPDDPVEAVVLEKEVRKAGKTFVTKRECLPPLKRSEDDLSNDIKSLIDYRGAKEFRVKLPVNVLRGHLDNALAGFRCGGRAPYGFVRVLFNPVTKEQRPIPEGWISRQKDAYVTVVPGDDPRSKTKLDVVRRIASEYRAGLGGVASIAKRLNAEAIPPPDAGKFRKGTPTAGKWKVATIKEILVNPVYTGLAAYGRTSQGWVLRHDVTSPDRAREVREDEVIDAGKGRRVVNHDPSLWTLAPAPIPYEPVVPRDVWEANLRTLEERGKRYGTRGVPKCTDPNKYPLPLSSSFAL